MKISIVMSYYNRRIHLINTLNSIMNQHYDNLEIIIVNDNSSDEHNIDDMPHLFNKLDITVIKISKKDKWWVNPSVPYNIGFAKVTGDVVIIQNPECLHIGELIKTVNREIEDNKYLVFGCYASNKKEFENISKGKKAFDVIQPIKNRRLFNTKDSAWYQHSKYRPALLHFCSAISKKDLDKLGGFDERFAYGIGRDDMEFVLRIKRMNMNIVMIDNPFVLHQHHKPTIYEPVLTKKNNLLYAEIQQESIIHVNKK